jgi:DNA-binding response OmpR family regulator
MLVDDDEDILFLLEFQLVQEGFKVRKNLGGRYLMDQLQNQVPDLILLDLYMNYTNGSDLCRQIKTDKRLSRIIVLIMSGNQDIANAAIACMADGYIAKPVSFPDVKNLIVKYLANR